MEGSAAGEEGLFRGVEYIMSAALDTLRPSFREMVLLDIKHVLNIENASYSYPWSELNFRDCVRFKYMCHVVEYDARIVGYSICQVVAPDAHILNLCVTPELRGRGFAGLLLSFIQQQAVVRKARHIYLEVRPSNTRAISLYSRHGFENIGIRPGYYPGHSSREDAIVMSKQFRGG